MPVIQIEALPQAPEVDVQRALAAICEEVAALLGEEPSGTWATWRTLERYVEGSDAQAEQPRSTHPPIVRVIGFEGRPEEEVGELLGCVARVLARELGVEEGSVFAIYEEARSGRLHTGGELAERGRDGDIG